MRGTHSSPSAREAGRTMSHACCENRSAEEQEHEESILSTHLLAEACLLTCLGS